MLKTAAQVPWDGKKGLVVSGPGQHKVLVFDEDPLIGLTWREARERMKIKDLYFFTDLESFIRSKIEAESFDLAFVEMDPKTKKYEGPAVVKYLRDHGLPRIVAVSHPEISEDDPRFRDADFITDERVPPSIGVFLRMKSRRPNA